MYNADLLKHMDLLATGEFNAGENNGKSRKKRGVRESTSYPNASNKEYAKSRGVERGGFDPSKDESGDGEDIPLDTLALDEGLYTLVQTGKCRRLVLTRVFQNEPAST